MKKSMYYRTMYRRDNPIKNFITLWFYDFCSIPRMILEVSIRRSLGRRYFSFTLAMMVLLLLLLLPVAITYLRSSYYQPQLSEVILENLTWYCFIIMYLIFCLKRRREQKGRTVAEFDFRHFSYSAGHLSPFFNRFSFLGKEVSLRAIETIVEPLFFAGISLVLILFGQLVGWLILFCAVCYSISYHAAYWQGDDIMMDYIDERIINESLFEVFVDGDEYSTRDGFRYRGPRPANRGFRKNLADDMVGDDENTATAI